MSDTSSNHHHLSSSHSSMALLDPNSGGHGQQNGGHHSPSKRRASSPFGSDFVGKVCIVTGVTRAFGRQMAVSFGREGASLTVQGPSMDRLTAVKDSLARLGVDSRRVLAVSGPTLEEGTAMELVERTLQRFGKIDALIVCIDLISDSMDQSAADQLFGATMRWLVYLASLLVKPLARTHGSIVVVSAPLPRTVSTAQWHKISRSAIEGWVQNAAQLYGAKGIRVNGLNVGPIRADFRSRQANHEEEQSFTASTPTNALRRTGTLDEVGSVAVFLANPARASFLTGQVLNVDGGMC